MEELAGRQPGYPRHSYQFAFFFFSSRRRHTRLVSDWSSDVCSSDLDEVTRESIEAEFPGWEAFQGVDRKWHARIKGATPPVMVHDDDLDGLREEIRR